MSTIDVSQTTDAALCTPMYRFSVEQYHQLGEMGILSPEDRVELLDGLIVKKMNQKPAHGFTVAMLTEWLLQNLPAGHIGRCQLPICIEGSEPEPDLAVVHGVHSDFRARHPNGIDCRLVIEVADTSVLKDRAKTSIYAAAGIDEYWIVNLVDNQLERFVRPSGSSYQETSLFSPEQTIKTTIVDTTLSLGLATIFAE